MLTSKVELLDDRLLIEHLLSGADVPTDRRIATTSLWYYRACRASVLGAAGHLSGPFARLEDSHQRTAIRRLLQLGDDVELPDPKLTVPAMARLAERHPRLNVLNLEAAAAATTIGATVLLSSKAALGILPVVLDTEGIPWEQSSVPS